MADGSQTPKVKPVEEIIIIKRSQPAAEGHHGGAWKIAYADFVTAMMAFFLVMWLINAANEKTKAQVASYFNPVKLVDNTTSAKGIKKPGDRSANSSGEKGGDAPPSKEETPPAEEAKPAAEAEKKEEKSPKAEAKPEAEGKGAAAEEAQPSHVAESKIFDDPFRLLAQIARQLPANSDGKSEKTMIIKETERTPPNAGDLARDPFDPLAWKLVAPTEHNSEVVEGTPGVAEEPNTEEKVEPKVKPAETKVEKVEQPLPALSPKENLALKEAEQIKKELVEELATLGTKKPDLQVNATKEGVLISLTDSASFDMFDVGSARPRPVVVKLMEKVAVALKDFKGHIIVRGHTDGRPYRGNGYDNWRLSMARAQMAYYMLIRAGVEESVVERIEGYADRSLLNSGDSLSAENRRIEILLKVAEP